MADYREGERDARDTHVWVAYDNDYEYQITLIGESITQQQIDFLLFVLGNDNWDPTQEGSVTETVRSVLARAGITFTATDIFTVTFDPDDADYKATQNTIDWIQQNSVLPGAGSTSLGVSTDQLNAGGVPVVSLPGSLPDVPLQENDASPEETAEEYANSLIISATQWGFDLSQYQGENLLMVTLHYIRGLEHIAANPNMYQAIDGIEQVDVELARMYELLATFAPSLNYDIVEWADQAGHVAAFAGDTTPMIPGLANLSGTGESEAGRAIRQRIEAERAEAGIREELIADARAVGVYAQESRLDLMNLAQLGAFTAGAQADYINNRALLMNAVVANSANTILGLEADADMLRMAEHQLVQLAHTNPELHALYLQSRDEARHMLAQLNVNSTLALAFQGQYDPGPPPEQALIQIVASIILEPVDWVLTGIDIYHAAARGDWGSVVLNTALALAPGIPGTLDNIVLNARRLQGVNPGIPSGTTTSTTSGERIVSDYSGNPRSWRDLRPFEHENLRSPEELLSLFQNSGYPLTPDGFVRFLNSHRWGQNVLNPVTGEMQTVVREHGAFFSRDGELIQVLLGDTPMEVHNGIPVAFPRPGIPLPDGVGVQGGIFIHNHPSGGMFSDHDIHNHLRGEPGTRSGFYVWQSEFWATNPVYNARLIIMNEAGLQEIVQKYGIIPTEMLQDAYNKIDAVQEDLLEQFYRGGAHTTVGQTITIPYKGIEINIHVQIDPNGGEIP
ncbi:MAG: hypothetical protein SF123_07960 [Chloroflexota bacterium]|nr:hypothetical protein [Chloroflexota bacterium]